MCTLELDNFEILRSAYVTDEMKHESVELRITLFFVLCSLFNFVGIIYLDLKVMSFVCLIVLCVKVLLVDCIYISGFCCNSVFCFFYRFLT